MNLKIKDFNEINGTVKAPPSKSYSHRAVILASLAHGTSKLYDVLYSEDVLASIRACEALGAVITGKLHNNSPNPSEDMIDLANSGTTLRIMTSLAALSDNEVIFTGDDSLKTRPMGALLDALKPLGVKTVSKLGNDKAPIKIMPGYQGGESEILGSISSQFISSILISAPLTEKGVFLEVFPQFVSKPYVDMTISIMKTFGVGVDEEETGLHEVCTSCEERCLGVDYSVSPQKYMSCDYVVEGDYSSASYLLARNSSPKSLQGFQTGR